MRHWVVTLSCSWTLSTANYLRKFRSEPNRSKTLFEPANRIELRFFAVADSDFFKCFTRKTWVVTSLDLNNPRFCNVMLSLLCQKLRTAPPPPPSHTLPIASTSLIVWQRWRDLNLWQRFQSVPHPSTPGLSRKFHAYFYHPGGYSNRELKIPRAGKHDRSFGFTPHLSTTYTHTTHTPHGCVWGCL